tara:strand:+ start:441 stop:650 length:210 start_codon:yes stop_codon:yes gene_type:complete
MIAFNCHPIDDSESPREAKANIGSGLEPTAIEPVRNGGHDRIDLTCGRVDLRSLAGGLSQIKIDRAKQP